MRKLTFIFIETQQINVTPTLQAIHRWFTQKRDRRHQKSPYVSPYKNKALPLPTDFKQKFMSVFRVILSIIFPPLAVLDRGCGSVLIVFILTLVGWIPGVIAALIILNKNE